MFDSDRQLRRFLRTSLFFCVVIVAHFAVSTLRDTYVHYRTERQAENLARNDDDIYRRLGVIAPAAGDETPPTHIKIR
ncbi:MAG: hypothetical protein H6865_04235 [Rhodospirillales bacterium]|nr:hypothetical protein [Alphaproteobacteria bacterium]MCB9986826.1 hypothetical protein [Rhodospirillales bacterium]USO08410.1 MAG: hypothetical protein H6866_04145 [Rhodospirillales bacterium]